MITIKEQLFVFMKMNSSKSFTVGKLKQEVFSYVESSVNSTRNISLSPKAVGDLLIKAIKDLKKADIIRVSKSKKIYFNKANEFRIGKIYTNNKGYGFLIPFENNGDVFIPSNAIKNAMHQDIVIVKIIKPSNGLNRGEGLVIDIVQRSLDTVVGTFVLSEDKLFGFVVPDNKHINKDIYIPLDKINGANTYDKVLCEIEVYPERNRKPEGKITEVIGLTWDKGVEALSIIKDYKIRHEFPPKLLKYIDKLSNFVSEEDMKGRLDLRGELIFTIDGEDSKDLDDAISIDVLDSGNYVLGVHIADVSHYVKRGSRLDDEALERCTSVYLINQVVPMLPRKLSNGICSLNPNEDRLTLTVFMEIDNIGNVVRYEMKESVINSRAKLNYTEVTSYLEGSNGDFQSFYPEIADALRVMQELMYILRKKRDNRGAIEFNFSESKIILDESDKPLEIMAYPRGVSNELIQEFMLICNETVAHSFEQKGIPFVYRAHEYPREEKLNEFIGYVRNNGVDFPEFSSMTPLDIQRAMSHFSGKPEEPMLNLLLLQSMQQARYVSEPEPHFGLASKHYCHFTSPIRRYPDLEIHRIIKDYINGVRNFEDIESRVDVVSKLASKKSRIAERAEKDFDNLKKMEYMKEHLKEVFDGIIIKVSEKGLNVLLSNTIEGFVPTSNLDMGECRYDEKTFSLMSDTGKTYRLGQGVVVQVDKVDDLQRMIVFTLPN